MTRVAIALGSNLGERLSHLCHAVESLGALGEVVATSSVYETEPVGGPAQGPYLNAVVVVDTDLEAHALLDALLAIEQGEGRRRAVRWGPRTLDLDLLLYGEETVDDDRLVVPHPRLLERRFVLEPLVEVWPGAATPDGAQVHDALARVQDQEVRRTKLRLEPRRSTFTARGGWWVVAQGVVLVASLLALADDPGFPEPWMAWLGAVVAGAGALQAILGLRHLGTNLTPYPQPLESARLVGRGVYRLVRHPIYGGIVLMMVGAGLFRASVSAMVVGAVGGVFFWFKARFEEGLLRCHYSGYADYATQVTRRLIPWVV
ncbi:MAG: 2-amino-4-hydroxy-6-hydroxymethyldihydropteridine diphosphokinase [Acidimicrobiia bacterium]